MPIPADQYWAGPAVPYYDPRFAEAALERFNAFQQRLRQSRLHDRCKRSWMMHNARSEDGGCDETQLLSAGENDEVVLLRPGRYRRLNHDAVTLVMETPPDYEPQAANSDPDTQAQCTLVLGLLDYYRRIAHLEDLGIEQADYAQCLAAGFKHIRWDKQTGEPHGVEPVTTRMGKPVMEDAPAPSPLAPPPQPLLPETNAEIQAAPKQQPKMRQAYKGDFVFSVRSLYEVSYDVTSPDKRRPRWWVVLEPENKFDLLAEHEHEGEDVRQAILRAQKWSHFAKDLGYEKEEIDHDDSIGVYWVYVEASAACPEGRMAKVLDKDTVLLDGPLDEVRAGVFRLAVSDVIFKNGEAHTNAFDGMSTAKAHHAQLSTILSNQSSYGLQRVAVARKSNVKMAELDTGLSAVHYDHFDPQSQTALPEPKSLDLLNTPAEMFTMLDVLEAELDLVMHSSPVNRGDPEAVKGDSGSKTALMFSAVQKIGSGFVRAKLRCDEDEATFLVSSLQRHATVERIVAITGQNKKQVAVKFSQKSIDKIQSVLVRRPDPARDTFQGRMAVAEMLIGIDDPQKRAQMQSFLTTGKLEAMMDPVEQQRLLLDAENEAILDPGKPIPPTLPDDDHMAHMRHHTLCMTTIEARSDKALVARYMQHMQGHKMAQAALAQPAAPPDAADKGAAPQHGGGNGGPPKAPKPGTGPKMPDMPEDPSTGQRVPEGPGAPQPPKLGGAAA